MGWELLIPLISQVGVPLAERIWQKAVSGNEVTQADWDELNSIGAESPQTHLAAIALRLGIPMTDSRIQAISALITSPL